MTGGVDPTVLTAFAVGAISFLSPCVLPLVPGYLSAVSGVDVKDLSSDSRRASTRVLGPAIVFCLTFTLVFVALGLTATSLGSLLNTNRRTLETVAGVVIIALGVMFLLSPLVPRLNRDWHVDALMRRAGSGGPVLAGAAFAIAWTPCAGPTLGAILTTAATQQTISDGGVLLAFYSFGLAVPFLACAIAFNHATGALRFVAQHHRVLTAVSGAILIGMGILVLTGQLPRLNGEAQQLLERLGLDFYNF